MFKNNSFTTRSFRFVLSAVVLLHSVSTEAEEVRKDSLRTKTLKEVIVNGQQLQIARASLPEQLKNEKEISTLNAANVADVAKYFSGVTLKDYGGIGGMKTVSLRGLGSQHTGVCYDGLMLSDVQSGEIDLGRFTVDNISEISLNNGQPNDIFQSSRMFASAGVLSFRTKFPDNDENHKISGKVTAKTGSFGLLDGGIFLMQNIGKKWAYNFSTDAQIANGEYKFVEYYGSTSNLSETLNRKNSDVQSVRSELNIQYHVRQKENISLKTNYFQSERGLPGAVTWYNTYSKERLWDKVFFTQLHYENRISDKLQYQSFAKFNNAYNRYRDLGDSYTNGILQESYRQKEYYLSSGLLYRPVDQLQLSASADWWYNDLMIESTNVFTDFRYPTRHSGLANLAAKYTTERLTLGTNVLYTLTREKVRTGAASPDRNKLSPTVSASYKILEDKDFRIRAFYKNSFRVPTFNELYYQNMGNQNLRPENTNQFNLGLTYLETSIPFLSELSCSIDGYYNQVTDKIVAVPLDLFHWSMTNKDKVDIKGVDANLKMVIRIAKADKLSIITNFSYNKATDVTSGSANYGEQIPYTPFYSGSCSTSYRHGMLEAGYNLFFSGKRWNGQNITANKIDAYMIHSVFGSAYYKNWKLTGEIINLLNTQYEIYKFYPMPGMNFRFTLSKTF